MGRSNRKNACEVKGREAMEARKARKAREAMGGWEKGHFFLEKNGKK